MIFHCAGIEGQDFELAAFLDPLIKASARFFSVPAAANHFLDQRRDTVEFAGFVVRRVVVDVTNDIDENVEPDDIGGIAVMLAGKDGAFITGQTIIVDGGINRSI